MTLISWDSYSVLYALAISTSTSEYLPGLCGIRMDCNFSASYQLEMDCSFSASYQLEMDCSFSASYQLEIDCSLSVSYQLEMDSSA